MLVVVDSDGNGHAGEVADGEQVGGRQDSRSEEPRVIVWNWGYNYSYSTT